MANRWWAGNVATNPMASSAVAPPSLHLINITDGEGSMSSWVTENTRRAAIGMAFAVVGHGLGKMGFGVVDLSLSLVLRLSSSSSSSTGFRPSFVPNGHEARVFILESNGGGDLLPAQLRVLALITELFELSTSLVVGLSESATIISLIASFIYLIGFFCIDLVQSFIVRASHDTWDVEDDAIVNADRFILEEDRCLVPCPAVIVDRVVPPIPVPITIMMDHPTVISLEEDEEIVKSVVSDTIPPYSLESKLANCHCAASIQRAAVQRITGRMLVGLSLDGFNYDSIIGQ
ncbi:hydroxymethylglutaryl-CoA reductase (NADPH) [Sarracenia purpurea var. burkii]